MDASLEVLEKYGLVADEDSFRVLEFDRKRAFKRSNFIGTCGNWFSPGNKNLSAIARRPMRSVLWRVLLCAGARPAHRRSVVFRN
jgi:hypothetical protein